MQFTHSGELIQVIIKIVKLLLYERRKTDGSLARTDPENMEEWKGHFKKVLNIKREIDPNALDEIESKETMHELDSDITQEELLEALSGMKNGKAGGENGVTPDLIKALKSINQQQLFDWCKKFWDGEMDFDSWHRGLLIVIHKAGKDAHNPNSYQGVNLMDVVSKLLS